MTIDWAALGVVAVVSLVVGVLIVVLVSFALVGLSAREADPADRTLAVDPGRIDRLGARLIDLVELRIDLPAWELADTADYVASEIKRAGGDEALFSDQALVRLHELTRGVPRRVNQLADLALLAGAGKQLTQIDAETVTTVHDELGIAVGAPVRV